MPHTLGHRHRPGPSRKRQPPLAHRIDGRPPPGASTLQALEGVVVTDRAGFEGTDHRVALIELPLRGVPGTEKRAHKGPERLGGGPQPRENGVGGHLAHAGRGTEAQPLSQAGEHTDDQLA